MNAHLIPFLEAPNVAWQGVLKPGAGCHRFGVGCHCMCRLTSTCLHSLSPSLLRLGTKTVRALNLLEGKVSAPLAVTILRCVVGGEDSKHRVLLKNKHVAVTCLMLLWDCI